jgi:hypothetical protein
MAEATAIEDMRNVDPVDFENARIYFAWRKS